MNFKISKNIGLLFLSDQKLIICFCFLSLIILKLSYLISDYFQLFFILFSEVLLGFVFYSYRNSKGVKVTKSKSKIGYLFLASILLGVFSNSFVVLFSSFLPFTWIERTESITSPLLNLNIFGVNVILFTILLFLPVVEEIIFRKYLLSVVVNNRVPFSSTFVSLFFVFSHPSNFFKYIAGVFLLFLLSEQLNFLYLKTGQLLFPIVMHLSFDFSRGFVRNIFYDDNVSSLVRNSLMAFENLIFIALVVFVNMYLVRQREKIDVGKSNCCFSYLCWGGAVVFVGLNVFLL